MVTGLEIIVKGKLFVKVGGNTIIENFTITKKQMTNQHAIILAIY